jgi:hypothetical protein
MASWRHVSMYYQPRHHDEASCKLHVPVASPPSKKSGNCCVGDWVGGRAGLDVVSCCDHTRVVQSEAYELYWQSYSG